MNLGKSSRNINSRLVGQAYLRLSDRLGNAMRRRADAISRIEIPLVVYSRLRLMFCYLIGSRLRSVQESVFEDAIHPGSAASEGCNSEGSIGSNLKRDLTAFGAAGHGEVSPDEITLQILF